MKAYAISGLGADERVFKFLKLNTEIEVLLWIKPKKNESIQDYAFRLSSKINTDEKFCLIGVSFGGLIAIEISKILNPELTILISSAKTSYELPFIYKTFGKTKISKFLPKVFFDPPKFLASKLFGAKNKKLLFEILNDTDLEFAKWAVNALIIWKNNDKVKNCYKIHGTKDALIPFIEGQNTFPIPNGKHFMIVDKADEVSSIINKILTTTHADQSK